MPPVDRETEYPIEPIFATRWSPRSFTGESIPDSVLLRAFEAARWAPSAFNLQPWRFIVARQEDAEWVDLLGLLVPRNQKWAAQASALIVVLSQTKAEIRGQLSPIASHSFDVGAAWSNFAHQALLLGWHTHGIGGFDREAARRVLNVPEDFSIDAVIAIGRRGSLDTLDPDFHEQERPSGRRALAETVFAGRFGTPAFSKERAIA